MRLAKAYHFGHAALFLSELFVEQSPALRELAFEVRMREPASPSAQHPCHPHTHSQRHRPVCHRACCQLLREITLDEFMQINSLDDDLAWAFDIEDGYFDIDGDGYISSDELRLFVLMMLGYDYPYRSDFSFSHGHAKLAVMMADRDGDGKLSMAEMQTLIDGSYKDDTILDETMPSPVSSKALIDDDSSYKDDNEHD
jgi:hypothetical protein